MAECFAWEIWEHTEVHIFVMPVLTVAGLQH